MFEWPGGLGLGGGVLGAARGVLGWAAVGGPLVGVAVCFKQHTWTPARVVSVPLDAKQSLSCGADMDGVPRVCESQLGWSGGWFCLAKNAVLATGVFCSVVLSCPDCNGLSTSLFGSVCFQHL